MVHTNFSHLVPCKLNSPTLRFLLEDGMLGSFTPHLDLLINSRVLLSIRPVTGIFPNLWSLLTAFLNAGELGSFAPALSCSFKMSRYPNLSKNFAAWKRIDLPTMNCLYSKQVSKLYRTWKHKMIVPRCNVYVQKESNFQNDLSNWSMATGGHHIETLNSVSLLPVHFPSGQN